MLILVELSAQFNSSSIVSLRYNRFIPVKKAKVKATAVKDKDTDHEYHYEDHSPSDAESNYPSEDNASEFDPGEVLDDEYDSVTQEMPGKIFGETFLTWRKYFRSLSAMEQKSFDQEELNVALVFDLDSDKVYTTKDLQDSATLDCALRLQDL